MKVAHFTPAYTPIHWGQTGQLLRESDTFARLGYEWTWWAEESTDIVSVRNRALQKAIDRGWDYLIMQDSDIFSDAKIGAGAALLETARKHNATAVAALVGLRTDPPKANVWPLPERPGDVYAAEKAGTGIMLIDVNQVKAWDYDGAWFATTYKDARQTKLDVGEDIFFCKLIEKMGGSLYVDSRIPTTHVRRDHQTLAYPGAVIGNRDAEQTDAAA